MLRKGARFDQECIPMSQERIDILEEFTTLCDAPLRAVHQTNK